MPSPTIATIADDPVASRPVLAPGVPYALTYENASPDQALTRALRQLAARGHRDIRVTPYGPGAAGSLAPQLARLTLEAYPGVVVVMLAPAATAGEALALASNLHAEVVEREVRVLAVTTGPATASWRLALACAGFADLPATNSPA